MASAGVYAPVESLAELLEEVDSPVEVYASLQRMTDCRRHRLFVWGDQVSLLAASKT